MLEPRTPKAREVSRRFASRHRSERVAATLASRAKKREAYNAYMRDLQARLKAANHR